MTSKSSKEDDPYTNPNPMLREKGSERNILPPDGARFLISELLMQPLFFIVLMFVGLLVLVVGSVLYDLVLRFFA